MMLPPASPTIDQVAQFFLAHNHAFAYNFRQQHPPRLSTMRTRGVAFYGFSRALKPTKIPATQHIEAIFGGFFMSAELADVLAGTCP